MRKVIFCLFLAAISAHCAPEIILASPYINRGVSLNSQLYYNPLIIEYNYRRPAYGNQYVGYANDIYLSQKKLLWPFYVYTGTKNEKVEFGGSWFFYPVNIKYRCKVNVFEGGENNLFQNLSLSLFLGNSMTFYVRNLIFDEIFTQRSNGYIQLYAGTAFGTRKKIIDSFSYIELFTSPQISLTYYGRLGGGEDYNPVAELTPSRKNLTFREVKHDFCAPIGVGFKRRLFFARAGVAVTTTLGGEKTRVNGGTLTVDSYNLPKIPYFVETGFHFMLFRHLEREMNEKEAEKEENDE
jgi:hypothetical protein